MSIYIPNMELPKSCISCPFMISRDNDDCILQSEEANESFENWEQMKAGCPLVEVKPHGRLIDADELMDGEMNLREATKYGNETEEQMNHSYSTRMMYEIADAIEEAETIIPADREATP